MPNTPKSTTTFWGLLKIKKLEFANKNRPNCVTYVVLIHPDRVHYLKDDKLSTGGP